jgi:hypothetical protein
MWAVSPGGGLASGPVLELWQSLRAGRIRDVLHIEECNGPG